jgi:hypothetical protein
MQKAIRLAIAAVLPVMIAHGAMAQSGGVTGNAFLNAVQQAETSGQANPYATNTGNGAYGAFQQRTPFLKDIGYENADGSWNAQKSGAASLSDYLQCSSCQVTGEMQGLGNDWKYLNANGAVSNYLGKVGPDGITYNQSALLECAQQMGAGGCNTYLQTGVNNSGNPHLVADIAAASATDSSAITGGNLQVNNSSLASGGTVSAGTAAAQMATYCSQQVQQMLAQNGKQMIDAKRAIAMSGQTGYTLMNGQGVLDAAGLGGSAGGSGGAGTGLFGNALNIGGNGQSSFMHMSCIDRMLNGGLNMIFTPPNLSSILAMLEQAVCQKATQMFSQLMQPVTQSLSQVTSMGGKSFGGGGFFPGLSLASLGGGINTNAGGGGMSVGIAGVGQAGTNASVSSVLNGDTTWYSRSQPSGSSRTAFPGLFGNAQGTGTTSSGGGSTGLFGNTGGSGSVSPGGGPY